MGQRRKEMTKRAQTLKKAMRSGQEIDMGSDSTLDLLMNFAKNFAAPNEKELRKNIEKNVKTYLNSSETKDFQWLLMTVLFGNKYRHSFMKFGNITKKEHADLKRSMTYLSKYCRSTLERLEQSQVDNIVRKLDGAEIKFFDKPTLKRLLVSTQDVISDVVVDRDHFETIAEIVLHQHCRNCTVDHSVCFLYETLSESFIPENEYGLHNCPYAYLDNNSDPIIQETVSLLMGIRDEKANLLKDIKFRAIHEDIAKEISALDKGIELALEKKGDMRDLQFKNTFYAIADKRDYTDEEREKIKVAIDRFVHEKSGE